MQAATIAATDGIVGHVAFVGRDLAAGLARPRDGFLHRLAALVGGEDLGALLREAHRGGAAVAPARTDAARAGDQRDLALQTSGHEKSYCEPRRPILSTSAPHFTRSDLM